MDKTAEHSGQPPPQAFVDIEPHDVFGKRHLNSYGRAVRSDLAIAGGLVKSPVKVHAAGGTQVVRWTDGKVFLRGPTQLICQGEFLG